MAAFRGSFVFRLTEFIVVHPSVFRVHTDCYNREELEQVQSKNRGVTLTVREVNFIETGVTSSLKKVFRVDWDLIWFSPLAAHLEQQRLRSVDVFKIIQSKQVTRVAG
jgi:hypothetical protein